jgi:hypothetical protein
VLHRRRANEIEPFDPELDPSAKLGGIQDQGHGQIDRCESRRVLAKDAHELARAFVEDERADGGVPRKRPRLDGDARQIELVRRAIHRVVGVVRDAITVVVVQVDEEHRSQCACPRALRELIRTRALGTRLELQPTVAIGVDDEVHDWCWSDRAPAGARVGAARNPKHTASCERRANRGLASRACPKHVDLGRG